MKLWEALEKSNKVRRKGYKKGLYYQIKGNANIGYRLFVNIPYSNERPETGFTALEVMSDDWEPYEEQKEAPSKVDINFLRAKDVYNDYPELLGEILNIIEEQGNKIERLEKAQMEHDCILKELHLDEARSCC